MVSGPEIPGLYPVYWGRRFLALALYNPHTDLAVRAYRFAPAEDPVAALLENLAQALARREAVLRQDPEGGYRLVHAEGDLLPGLVVDYYAGHAVVQATAHAWEGLLPQVAEALRPYVQSVLAKNDARTRELEGASPLRPPLSSGRCRVSQVQRGGCAAWWT